MDKNLINQLKEKLEKDKKNIEKQLEKFATKDEKLKDDWDTRFPRFDGRETGSAALEQAADEVEEYSTLLPIEYSLELWLKNINLALEKIKIGKYGICEKCQKRIKEERLKIYPVAQYCLNCKKPKKTQA
ncbi:MAG: TraR/DksA C4-type zinc finger protein [Candidatus Nealsonbacteria bacterium]|nr:TraR/DksA C4-type zinc finger protein [Candidatus Nealsonbacteria bacterium]